MNKLILPKLIALACFACTPLSQAAAPAAQKDTFRLWESCTMADPGEFRPADEGDFGDLWSHWMRVTGSAQPWRTEADFNGDGLTDVAWVALHRQQRGKWMVGVDFGRTEGAPCRVAQLASLEDVDRLPALLIWPQAVSSLICHAGETLHVARCLAPSTEAFRERDGAALLLVDRNALEFSIYVDQWVRTDASKPLLLAPTEKSDPQAVRRFMSDKPKIEIDWAESKRLQEALAPKVQESPDELRVAFEKLTELPHYIRFSESGIEGQPMHVVTELHFEAPDRYLEIQRVAGALRETLMIGDQTWYRADGKDWNALPPGMTNLISLPAAPQLISGATVRAQAGGNGAIAEVSARARNGFGEFGYDAEIETSSGRLLSEFWRFEGKGQDQKARYDYSKTPEIPAEPSSE